MNKKHIKAFCLILLLIGTVNVGFSQKGGEYRSKTFTGLSPKDGSGYLDIMQYDEKSKFMYLIRNDEKNLYVDVIMSDRAAIQKTMMYGFTTWLDPLGKKKKNIGIEFPVAGGGRAEQGQLGNRGEGQDRKAMMALAMQEKNSHMVLKGFNGKGSEEEINPMAGDGIRGKFDHLEGEKVLIALVVPLEKLGITDKAAMIKPLSIGFETGYMDLNRSGMAAGANTGGGGGDYHHDGPPGGGPPGGGMDQSGSGQQQPNLNQLASPAKMWVKAVRLSVK